MENNAATVTKTPAAVYAQCELDRDGSCDEVLVFNAPNYRSDEIFPAAEWKRLIATEISNLSDRSRRALHGTYNATIYITPSRETNDDTSISFREQIALGHTGQVSIGEDGEVDVDLSERPLSASHGGDMAAMSDEALATWSYDLEDMLDAYEAGGDAQELMDRFLADHH